MVETKHRRPKVDVDRVLQTKAEVEKRMEGRGDLIFWKPDWGENHIRILPPYSEAGIFWHDVAYHYGIAVDEKGQGRQVVCLSYGSDPDNPTPCPVCEKIAELKASGDEDDAAKADALKIKPRYYLQIIDRKNEAAGVQIYMASPTVANKVFGFYSSKAWGDITDPEKGYDIILIKQRRAGASPNSTKWQDTDYEVQGNPEKCPTMSDNDGNPAYDWEDQMVELDKLPRKYAYADLTTMLETGEFIEWDDRPNKEEKTKAKAAGKSAAESEPEEEEEGPTPKKVLQMDEDAMTELLSEYDTSITEYSDVENLREQILSTFFEEGAVAEARAELETSEEAPEESEEEALEESEEEAPEESQEDLTPARVFEMSEEELHGLLGEYETGLDPDDYKTLEEFREAILEKFFEEADIEAARPAPPSKPELKRPIPKKTLPTKATPKEEPKGKVVKKSTDMDDRTSAAATKDLKRRATKFQKSKAAAAPPVPATKKRVPVKKG